MIIYLSGPITGKEAGNRSAFEEAARALKQQGYSVLNPLDNFSGDLTLQREEYMRVDIGLVLAAQKVVLLPGWQGNKGCRSEVQVAFEIGTPVQTYDPAGLHCLSPQLTPFDLTDSWAARVKTMEPERELSC